MACCLSKLQSIWSRQACNTLKQQKLAGVEVLEIIETQLLQRRPDGSLVVESKPVLAAPGASKFLTHASFSMSNEVNSKKSCKVLEMLRGHLNDML